MQTPDIIQSIEKRFGTDSLGHGPREPAIRKLILCLRHARFEIVQAVQALASPLVEDGSKGSWEALLEIFEDGTMNVNGPTTDTLAKIMRNANNGRILELISQLQESRQHQ